MLSYNIWDGGRGRLGAIERVIRAQSPDVAALLEVTEPGAAEELAGRLRMQHAHGEARSRFGISWLTRLPIVKAQNHRLPVLEKTLLELDVPGLRLFATHLRAGRTEADSKLRTIEAAAIADTIGTEPCLLVGDLNAVAPADEVGSPPPEEELEFVSRGPIGRLLEAGFADCYRRLHPAERGWTYLSGHPWARFDHVLASGALATRVTRCDVVTGADALAASDHFPVVAEIADR